MFSLAFIVVDRAMDFYELENKDVVGVSRECTFPEARPCVHSFSLNGVLLEDWTAWDAVIHFLRHNQGHVPVAHFLPLKRQAQSMDDDLNWERIDVG